MGQQLVIETKDLTKSYNRFTAVDHLNIQVKAGEVFGFLGPNGAGKTTTILMLLGLTEPTSGMARVCGYNSTREPLKVKRTTGYLPEKVGFYEDLTARQNLRYIARLNAISDRQTEAKIPQLLAMVGLSGVVDRKVETFSKGMKQRLGIAGVLLKEPSVLFLDEPTSGLDPEGANFVLNLIVKLSREQNLTVMLSSHLLHQVQRICHRVAILSKGHLVAEGPVEYLAGQTFGAGQQRVQVETTKLAPQLVESLKRIAGVANVEQTGDRLLITCDKDVRPQISGTVLENNCQLLQMKLLDYGLEDIYLKYFHEGAE